MRGNDSEEMISSAVENFIGGICILEVDTDTKEITPIYLNDGYYRMMGGTRVQTDAIMTHLRRSVIPDDLPILDQGLEDIISDNGSAECEYRIVDHEGNLMWQKLRGNLYSRKGTKNCIIAVILDCTEQKTIEEELKRQSDYMHLLMDTDITFDFNCRTDVCIYSMTEADSLSHDEVVKNYIKQIPSIGIHEDYIENYTQMIESAMQHPRRDSMEFRSKGLLNHNSEEYRWFKVSIVSILGHEGYVSHVIGHITDIQEEKLKEAELRLRADRDSLTGLLNKEATKTLINNILETYSADGNITGALFMVDSDNFKHINDAYGHITGDRVLAKIGEILRDNFKGMDVTGRVGGDEFMVFLNNIRTESDSEFIAKKIGYLIGHAFDGEDFGADVSVSIGIALCPKHGLKYEELYGKADKALYHMKKNGKSGCVLYDDELMKDIDRVG
ncbi:MAG: diguanylate cyclase [Lachnospiraceae bacterium]|nr:diguanylate cyclase [Lachnospiraceae bacterium]